MPVANGINGVSPPVAAQNVPLVTDHVNRFFTKNSGVIFENENIQVGIKMEFRERLGRIQLFYGNMSQASDITGFQAEVTGHVTKL